MKAALACLLAACLPLGGCLASFERVQTVRVAVPVECDAKEPARPVMPTEHLPPLVPLDPFVRAAQAEIGLREAYEQQLRVALRTCIDPPEKKGPP